MSSILIKNFNGTDVIPFGVDPVESGVFLLFNGALLFQGLIQETIVVLAILRIRQKTVDTLFVLSLCSADLIFNLYQFCGGAILTTRQGWATGVVGCKINMALILCVLATSILSVTYMTLNRYLVIIWRKYISRPQSLFMIGITWAFFPSLFLIMFMASPELMENMVALQPGRFYCLIDFTSRDPLVTPIVVTTLVIMTIPMVLLVLAYTQIISFYIRMNRSRENIPPQVFYISPECSHLKVYDSERKLIVKAIAITASYFFIYTIVYIAVILSVLLTFSSNCTNL